MGAAAALAIGAHDALDVAPNVGIMLGALLIVAFPASVIASLLSCRQTERRDDRTG
ncbi:hypothetical protein ACQPTN_05215 [Bradyrhizobium sp. 13971]